MNENTFNRLLQDHKPAKLSAVQRLQQVASFKKNALLTNKNYCINLNVPHTTSREVAEKIFDLTLEINHPCFHEMLGRKDCTLFLKSFPDGHVMVKCDRRGVRYSAGSCRESTILFMVREIEKTEKEIAAKG